MFPNQIHVASSASAMQCAVGHRHGGDSHHHYGDHDFSPAHKWVTMCNCCSWVPLHTCLKKSHDHEYYSPLLYTLTAFQISMRSVPSITGLENFHDPQSYSIQKGVAYPNKRKWLKCAQFM